MWGDLTNVLQQAVLLVIMAVGGEGLKEQGNLIFILKYQQ